MFYDRVMGNIQNKHKRIKHMNSFLNTRRQRKLRKSPKKPVSRSQVSGLGSQRQGPRSQVSGPTVRVPVLRSRVLPMSWVPGLMSWVPSPGFRVSGPRTYLCDGFQVLRLGSHYQSCVWDPTFQTCRKKVTHLFSEYCIEKKPVINHSHSIKLYFKNNDSFHT